MKKMISIHLRDGKFEDVVGIPEDVEIVILDVVTLEQEILNAKDNKKLL